MNNVYSNHKAVDIICFYTNIANRLKMEPKKICFFIGEVSLIQAI